MVGRYFWIPVENIRKMLVEKPADLRDVVWTPVQFTWTNGGEAVGLIPTRYPGSETSADPLIRLARKTEWVEEVSGLQLGLGQRLWATDVADFALMDVREIDLDAAEAPPEPPPAAISASQTR